jgi:hypothetical protein
VNVLKPHLQTTILTLLAAGKSQREIAPRHRRGPQDHPQPGAARRWRNFKFTQGGHRLGRLNSPTPATGSADRVALGVRAVPGLHHRAAAPADDDAEIHDAHQAPSLHSAVTAVNAALAAQHRAVLAAATSDNTRRAYRSAVNHYLAWGGVLPADEAAIIRYLLTYVPTLNPRTLALRLTALSQWHVHQSFPDPASTPTVRKTLIGIARTAARRRKPRLCRSRTLNGSWRGWPAPAR